MFTVYSIEEIVKCT
uniref:Uncharacterized protein n=1 Tax=Arundo donax TaxID=35708 RepID=A0A0A9G4T0_ARUDO